MSTRWVRSLVLCTRRAARCTLTVPTSTRCSGLPGSVIWGGMCRTSTCTKRSAFRTVVVVRGSVPSGRRHTWHRFCRGIRSLSRMCTRGGGGAGVGPVAGKAHLAPFLPGHPLAQRNVHAGGLRHDGGPVSAAPFGSASILPISWAYVRMMGAAGLRDATAAAVLAANYVAARLRDHFPVLYTGDGGLVAHECILDVRPLTERTGVTVDDIAKRLVDYGFHAPTMSVPVAGTLMVEPTESEDLAELDRFIEAMIHIKAEADAVGRGEWPADDNPLHNAPHTAESVVVGEWPPPYSREVAVYPVPSLVRSKYWAPVRRVDQAYGDRNLVCSCPPVEAFASSHG